MDFECHDVRPLDVPNNVCTLTGISDATDPKVMTRQILAIAPILPGQKGNSDYKIPPRATSATTNTTNVDHHRPQNDQEAFPGMAGGENDLIDLGYSAPSARADAGNSNTQAPHRTRSVSLMDDDRHVYAMNDRMGKMNLMEPTKSPALPAPETEQPLKRTDTQTSEVDAFFDAEG